MKKNILISAIAALVINILPIQAASVTLNNVDKELFQAATVGNVKKVKEILAGECDVRYSDQLCNTALHRAAGKGYTEIVSLLVDYAEKHKVQGEAKPEGIDSGVNSKKIGKYVNFKNIHSMTALHMAVYEGHEDTASLLIEKGAHKIIHAHYNDLYEGPRCYGRPLHVAVQGGRLNCVKLLIKHGADIHFRDAFGRTALHYAALGGHLELYNFLCEQEAYENEMDNEGYSPIHLAALEGNTRLIESFSGKLCDVNKKDAQGRTLLHCAVKKGHRKTVGILLEREDIMVNLLDSDQKTALYYAFKSLDILLIKQLIEKKAEMYSTVVDYLKLGNNAPVAIPEFEKLVHTALTRAPISVAKEDSKRWKALVQAAVLNDHGALKLLIENADLTAKFTLGDDDNLDNFYLLLTKRLRKAVETNNQPLIELLIDADANILSENEDHVSALSIAVASNNIDLMKLMLEKGSPYNRTVSFQDVVEGRVVAKRTDFDRAVQAEFFKTVSKKECTPEMVDIFIKARVILGLPKCLGWNDLNDFSILHVVARNGNPLVAQRLIEKGARVEGRSNGYVLDGAERGYDISPLHIAAMSGSTQIAKIFLKAGAQPQAKDEQNRTALHFAAYAGDAKLCKILMAANVSVNDMTNYGRRPIDYAAYCKDEKKRAAVIAVLNGESDDDIQDVD